MMKEPTYDGGKYCVEYMEYGKWRKKKTGKYLSRNWNHITLRYAIHQFIEQTKLGFASRIVFEPTGRLVTDNHSLHQAPEWRAWKNALTSIADAIPQYEVKP